MQRNMLRWMQETLSHEGINAKIINRSASIQHRHLEFQLGLDYRGRPIVALAWLDEQVLSSQEHAKNKRLFLQIMIVLPFHFEDRAVSVLSRYLHVINKSLAFPGFGLSEPDRSVYYKYTFTFPEGDILKSFLLDIIGLEWLLHDTFVARIEAVASGSATLIDSVAA